MIPGGVGETEGSEEIATEVREAIARAHRAPDGGPVFVGPNSLGAVSKPGRYDTLFIPSSRLDKRWSAPARRVALVSQSGAFIVSRMSNLETLDPAFAFSLGNQLHVTPSDVVAALGERQDVDVIGVYTEGFNDLDGLELLRHIASVTEAGKVVVFYKAGRTEPGRSAAAGHTASVAGDYDVCQAAAGQAGALVADTFKEFEQLLEIGTALHAKRVTGVRLGVISNAGFETVGMADAIRGQRYAVEIAELSEGSTAKLREVLAAHGLSRLVNARSPLDITPMASEEVYEGAVKVMLESDDVDAVVVGVVPLTAALKTGPDEIDAPGSLAERIPRLFAEAGKPLIVVVDSGSLYEPLVRALRRAGVPVFPSADQAIRSLGRYLCHRAERRAAPDPVTEAASAP
jgi:acyl-CoA synthetase (NDP forming)